MSNKAGSENQPKKAKTAKTAYWSNAEYDEKQHPEHGCVFPISSIFFANVDTGHFLETAMQERKHRRLYLCQSVCEAEDEAEGIDYPDNDGCPDSDQYPNDPDSDDEEGGVSSRRSGQVSNRHAQEEETQAEDESHVSPDQMEMELVLANLENSRKRKEQEEVKEQDDTNEEEQIIIVGERDDAHLITDFENLELNPWNNPKALRVWSSEDEVVKVTRV